METDSNSTATTLCPAAPRWLCCFTGAPVAAAVLLAFYFFMLASLWEKSATVDEVGHVVSGYTYWRFNDYRLDPENGNLPQRVMALPLVFNDYSFPSDSPSWRNSDAMALGHNWLYRMHNDADAMLRRSRAANGLFALVLGALVWLWARQLFGPLGGMLSLLLYVFNPTILANGALTTSDTACALFFLAATWGIWAVLHRLTLGRLLLSTLALGGLFVSKMSAPLIVPIALVLLVARLTSGKPLPVKCGSFSRNLETRARQALAFLLAALAHALVVFVIIWASYGFRYAMAPQAIPGRDRVPDEWNSVLGKLSPIDLLNQLNPTDEQKGKILSVFDKHDAPPVDWNDNVMDAMQEMKQTVLTSTQRQKYEELLAASPPKLSGKVLVLFRQNKLLPEAYIYGLGKVVRASHRRAFMNGQFSEGGWKLFFPYTFLVKTPLAVFAVMILALTGTVMAWSLKTRDSAAGWWRPALVTLYTTLPLWMLQIVYWTVAISSHINIGHRHIIPVYPPLIILCGAAACWVVAAPAGKNTAMRRWLAWTLCAAVAVLAVEVLCRFPNYIAYFNGIVTPAHAYRHLVDSSLDWGQDLPGLKKYIEARQLKGPIYVSYFGLASPLYYKIPGRLLHGDPGWDEPPAMQVFDFPNDKADDLLTEALRQFSDYDLAGSAPDEDDGVVTVLLEKPDVFRLGGGTYFVSATMLQPVGGATLAASPFGWWNQRYERNYQNLYSDIKPLFDDDKAVRLVALNKHSTAAWKLMLSTFDVWRFYRLAAYLRQREPDDNVNYSILVYKLTDADLARAVDGPPPELGPDALAGSTNQAKPANGR